MSKRTTSLVRGAAVFVALLISALCGGCAFGHRVVALNYTADANAPKDGSGESVYVAALRDLSPTKDVSIFTKDSTGKLVTAKGKEIGDIRNGYYMKTACVVSKSRDLGPWITDAMTKELTQRGFRAVQVTSLPPQCPLGVSGSLNECYSKMMFFSGQRCTIKAVVSLHKNGAVISSKEYVGQSKGNLALCTAAEYEKIFQLAMADLVGKVASDVSASRK